MYKLVQFIMVGMILHGFGTRADKSFVDMTLTRLVSDSSLSDILSSKKN